MSLIIPHGKSLREVHETFPVGSYGVIENRQSSMPIYYVVQIGKHKLHGKTIKKFLAFSVTGNERAREQAEDLTRQLNEKFYEQLAQQEARAGKTKEKRALVVAQKNKSQTKLTNMWS